MIYLVGGAPRTGKSILGQQVAARLNIGWVSTDLLMELLRAKHVAGVKMVWDASPQAIMDTAEWFYPCLERFIWGVNAMTESYLIEGVDFLPAQAAQLAAHYPISAVFLGCAHMTPERFDQFPGRSRGYAHLPEPQRRQFAHDVPLWSAFVRQEAERCHYPYIDTSDDFPTRLREAKAILTAETPSI